MLKKSEASVHVLRKYFVFGIFELIAKTIYIKQTLNLQYHESKPNLHRRLDATVLLTNRALAGIT
jgi:hypothetical protein